MDAIILHLKSALTVYMHDDQDASLVYRHARAALDAMEVAHRRFITSVDTDDLAVSQLTEAYQTLAHTLVALACAEEMLRSDAPIHLQPSSEDMGVQRALNLIRQIDPAALASLEMSGVLRVASFLAAATDVDPGRQDLDGDVPRPQPERRPYSAPRVQSHPPRAGHRCPNSPTHPAQPADPHSKRGGS